MSPSPTPDEAHKAAILAILSEHRLMSLATLRPDGWPQTTMVGYVSDDLTLYCAVARSSQKWANIARDPRVSIAIGHDTPDRVCGLSLAARACEVSDLDEVERLNRLIWSRHPEQAIFAPREAASVVLRFTPKVISLIDLPKAGGRPELMTVVTRATVWPAEDTGAPPETPTRGVYLSPAAKAGPGPGDLDEPKAPRHRGAAKARTSPR